MLAARRRMLLATGVAGAVTFVPAAGSPASAAVPSAAAAPASAGLLAAPADSVRNSQWPVLNALDVPGAWSLTKGAGVTVAVIDSGVDPNVSDLTGSVTTGPDLTGLSTQMSNVNWGEHGTWMASIIAGHGHDGGYSGITGVAPAAKILSIRVIPDKGDPGYHRYEAEPEQKIQLSLAKGIMDAARAGARVISMSIGYSGSSAAVQAALQYAYSHGAVLVASSGNSGYDDQRSDYGFARVSFPADYPGVLGVGALGSTGKPAGFSSNNLSVQVAAPGVGVPAQGRDGLYWTVNGTSPACALVAGVAALIESKYPGLAPALVDEALTSTAKNPSGGYNARTGFGTVDAYAALRAAGQLEKTRAEGSQVAASARFGGGPAAVPAAPVPPRGISRLVLFTVLALMSLALAAAGGMWLNVLGRPRRGVHAAPHPGPSGSRSPPGGGYEWRRGYAPGPGHAPGSGYGPDGEYGPGGGYAPGGRYAPGQQQGPGHAAPGADHGGQDDGWQRQ